MSLLLSPAVSRHFFLFLIVVVIFFLFWLCVFSLLLHICLVALSNSRFASLRQTVQTHPPDKVSTSANSTETKPDGGRTLRKSSNDVSTHELPTCEQKATAKETETEALARWRHRDPPIAMAIKVFTKQNRVQQQEKKE